MLIRWRRPGVKKNMRHFCAFDAPLTGQSCATPVASPERTAPSARSKR
jgi:hypothetical protein